MDAVTDAFRGRPADRFLPEALRRRARAFDGPLDIGHGQTNSQPRTVEDMLRLLDVRPGQRVLDVGLRLRLDHRAARAPDRAAGRGAGRRARARPGGVRPRQPGPDRPALGADRAPRRRACSAYPAHAPYDRILVSAAGRELPAELVDQLAPEGRMVIPVSGRMVLRSSDAGRAGRDQPARQLPVRAPALTRAGRGPCVMRPAADVTSRPRAAPARLRRQLPRRRRHRRRLPDPGRRTRAPRRLLPLQRAPARPTTTPLALVGLGLTAIHDLRGRGGRRAPRRRGPGRDAGTTSRSPASRWRPGRPASTDADAADRVMQRVYDAFVAPRRRARAVRGAAHRRSRPSRCRSSSTAPPARTAPAGRPRCCSRSPASTARRSWPTTCSPTRSRPATRAKYLTLIAEHLGEDKVAGLRADDGRRGVATSQTAYDAVDRGRTARSTATCATDSASTTRS